MLQRHISRYRWLVDNSPGPDVEGRVVIGGGNVPARFTGEQRLRDAIRLFGVSALRALLRCVARVNGDNWHAESPRLVLNERPQLPEPPIVQHGALLAPGLNPVADSRQFFNGNRTVGALRFLHDAPGDAVVHIGLIAGLSARNLFQFSFCRTCFLALQIAAAVGMLAAQCLYALPAMAFPVAIECKINNTEVNAKHVAAFSCGRFFNVADTGDVPLAAHEHQIHFAFAVLQQFALPFSADVFDFLPPAEKPDGHGIIRAEAEDAVIIGLRGCGLEDVQHCAPALVGVGIRDFADTTHGNLRGEHETLAQLPIYKAMQLKNAKGVRLICFRACKIARGIAGLERLFQTDQLFLIGPQLDICNELHGSIIEYAQEKVNRKGAGNSSVG